MLLRSAWRWRGRGERLSLQTDSPFLRRGFEPEAQIGGPSKSSLIERYLGPYEPAFTRSIVDESGGEFSGGFCRDRHFEKNVQRAHHWRARRVQKVISEFGRWLSAAGAVGSEPQSRQAQVLYGSDGLVLGAVGASSRR